MISLADLTTPVPRARVEQSLYDALGKLGVSTTSWMVGSVVRAMVTSVSLFLSSLSYLQAAIAKSGFLELASGDWLALVALYVFGVEKVQATFAAGEVTLTNPGGGVYTYDPDDLTVRNSATDKSYRNTAPFTLNAGETLTIAVQAVEAGAASTSIAGAVDEIESGPTGVTVTNATAIVGADAESDPALRTRCLEKLGALSPNGPWDAYSYVAKNAKRADGSPIGVTRARLEKDGYGFVTLFVATATGGVTGDENDPDTDLGAINEAVQRQAVPQAVTASTASAVPVTVPVTYTLTLYNTVGQTEDQIKDAVGLRLASFMSTQPIGGNKIPGDGAGKVYGDAIRTVIGATYAHPITIHVVVSLPAGDTALDVDEVPVLGTVTGTIVQVAPPDGGVV
jgi:phage-related baseplate assembly protein